MKRAPLTAAIIGCGTIAGLKDRPRVDGPAGTHAQAYHRHPDIEIVAAADVDSDSLAAFQASWAVARAYTSLEALLEECPPDIISLCTPTDLHAGQIAQILNAKKQPRVLFAEKPVCRHPGELSRLAALAQRSDCLILINHSRRFDPAHVRLSEIVAARELGAFVEGRCDYYGGWLNNGCHVVDTLRMILGAQPSVLSASCGAPGRDDDVCLDVRLRCDNGAVCEIRGFDERYYQLFEMQLRFENGRICIGDFGAQIIIERADTNDIGERVLAGSPERLNGLDSPLLHAAGRISDYINTAAPLHGCGALLGEASGTMAVLWEPADMAEKTRWRKRSPLAAGPRYERGRGPTT